MELYLDPVWVKPKKERKPHPLKGKHQWPTDDPEKRARILEGLKKRSTLEKQRLLTEAFRTRGRV